MRMLIIAGSFATCFEAVCIYDRLLTHHSIMYRGRPSLSAESIDSIAATMVTGGLISVALHDQHVYHAGDHDDCELD